VSVDTMPPRSIVVLFAVLLAPVAARAEDEARAFYDRGIIEYRLGRYDAAIEDFRRAYERKPVPPVLFNLAQAYRQIGDRERALSFYRAFVRQAPASPARTDAEAMIAALEAQAPPDPPRPARPEPPPPPPVATRTQPPRMSRGSAIALVATTAVTGVALLATGGGLAAHARDIESTLNHPGPDARWTPEVGDQYDEGQAAHRASIALYVVGAGVLAASVVSAIVWRKALRGSDRVQARGLTWTF
jgi:tetratricopeptide (TPR) repeat protein